MTTMPDMTSWERVQAALKGEDVDRPPVSLWRHFYDREPNGPGLVEAMLGFQDKYKWDFMKVNPRASYHAEDWGLKLRFSADPLKSHERLDYPVKHAVDWDKVQPLDPHQGVLGEHLEAVAAIGKALNGRIPFLMTVFTPLSVASRLTGSYDEMARHLQESPKQVHSALAAITETFGAFVRGCLARGASGIFFATTVWATHNRLTDAQYREFGRPYDLKVLEAAAGAPFNLLHVCETRNMLSALADYPVPAFNWDAHDPSNHSLAVGRVVTGRTVVGGISGATLLKGSPEDVIAQAMASRHATAGRHFMLAAGCTIAPETPEANIAALSRAFAKP